MKIQKNKTCLLNAQGEDSSAWLDYIIKHIPAAKAFGLIQSVITKSFALYLWIWGACLGYGVILGLKINARVHMFVFYTLGRVQLSYAWMCMPLCLHRGPDKLLQGWVCIFKCAWITQRKFLLVKKGRGTVEACKGECHLKWNQFHPSTLMLLLNSIISGSTVQHRRPKVF